MERTAFVEKTGVVNMYNEVMTINGESIMNEVNEAVHILAPKTDYNGNYAAKVTITVELLGDMKEKT